MARSGFQPGAVVSGLNFAGPARRYLFVILSVSEESLSLAPSAFISIETLMSYANLGSITPTGEILHFVQNDNRGVASSGPEDLCFVSPGLQPGERGRTRRS